MEHDTSKTDDHHCSVIERDRIGAELATCDENSKTDDERNACHKSVKKFSGKREQACKYS